MREVQFVGGLAGASSIESQLHQPSNAFIDGSKMEWHSGRDKNGIGELYHAFPHLIWYKFPVEKAFIPAMMSFSARVQDEACGAGYCGATKYQFIGSNDPHCSRYSIWTTLCQDLSGAIFKRGQSKYCIVDRKFREKFSCLGIRVLEGGFSKYNAVAVSGVKMWAYT